MGPEEIWITRTFGDLPIGASFWSYDYEFTKVSSNKGIFSGDLHEFSLGDEVGILILCNKED